MKSNRYLLFLSIVTVILYSCGRDYTPREPGYFRIDLPEKKYVLMDSVYPYSFEMPEYTQLKTDKYHPDTYNSNLVFPRLKATLHLTYFKVNGNIDGLFEDNRKMVYKHTIKADAINEQYYEDTVKHVYGALYEIKGNAASSVQFYVTDSTQHFLRGALYFNTKPNKDSLAPVIQFVEEDIIHLIETLSWK
ncbi:MAG: gliding motility lipoprotein GldD [Chlorobi bacterium]|nr:gliding motility lipoprotein GldD [Chlorobiota bacterium]